MRQHMLQIFFSFFPFWAFSQLVFPLGARYNGVGNATVALPDVFSVFSNPACLTGLQASSLGLYTDHRYNMSGMNNVALSYCHVQKEARVAAGIGRYGDELLNQTRAEIGFAYKIRLVSLGGGIGYHQLAVAELNTAWNVLFQFGGMAEITPKLRYAAHIYNVTRAKTDRLSSSYYPVVMSTGISYLVAKQVLLLAEVEKSSLYPVNFKVGIEYTPSRFLVLRTGVNSAPSQGFLGLGIKWKGYGLDYALAFQNRLGNVHSLSLLFFLPEKKTASPKL